MIYTDTDGNKYEESTALSADYIAIRPIKPKLEWEINLTTYLNSPPDITISFLGAKSATSRAQAEAIKTAVGILMDNITDEYPLKRLVDDRLIDAIKAARQSLGANTESNKEGVEVNE